MVNSPSRVPKGTPRWVKGFGAVALILIVFFIVHHLTSGGMSHFGAHLGGQAASQLAPTASKK